MFATPGSFQLRPWPQIYTPILTAATLYCMHLRFISPMPCLCVEGLRSRIALAVVAGGTRQRRLNIILMHLSEYSRLQAIIVSSCVSSIMVSYQVAPDLCWSRSYSTPTGCPLATKRQEAHRHQPLDSTHSRPGNLERKRSFDDPGAEPQSCTAWCSTWVFSRSKSCHGYHGSYMFPQWTWAFFRGALPNIHLL